MFNLSLPELLVIGAAGLIFLGPRRLPQLAKSLGEGIREFKKAVEGNEEEPEPKTEAEAEPEPAPRALAPAPSIEVARARKKSGTRKQKRSRSK